MKVITIKFTILFTWSFT